MNINNGALYFGAGIDTAQFRRDIDSMRRDILGLSQTTVQETRQMDSAFKNLSIGITSYFSASALKGFVTEMINVRGEFQKTEIAFTTMLGNAGKAKALMEQMVDLAAKTPFGLQEVSAGAKQLLAFQVPANQVVDILTRMGNIAAGLGVPLSRINLVYGQVKAKGKLMGDDLRQFTEAGIPMIAELAEKFGKTESEITDMVSAGKVGFKDVQDVLFSLTNEGGMFFNLMEKQSASLSGKVSNLGDAWDQMLNKIGQGNESFLYTGIDQLSMLVERYDAVIAAISTLVVSYGSYKAAIIVTSAAQTIANKTLESEIGLLSFSQRMKLGRAIVTQRQTAATLAEAQAESASLATKYATLQAEVSSLAVKKQKAVALGIEKAQILGNARLQLSLAQAELTSIRTNGTAREILIATKNVEKAQNTVLAAQESAELARKTALTAGSKFYTAQRELEVTAVALNSAAKNVETASEIANTAAKSANVLATQRLTIAQTAQTLAMTAASRAASLLNATLFANPYALATALIAAMAFAVYKYNTALTVAEESQKRMNDDSKTHIANISEQETKIKTLVKTIQDQTTSENKRSSALKQIHIISNGRLNQLDLEAIKTGKATGMIKSYIEALKLEAEAKRYVAEIGRNQSDIEDLKNNRGKFGFGDLWDDFTDFDSSFQWSLADRKKERIDRRVKEKEAENKKLEGKLNALANKGVNVSETQINEVPKTKSDEVLPPKKVKQVERELAEVYSLNSIADLQQRIDLWNESLRKASGDTVNVLNKDKFGDVVKTGKTVSVSEAVSEVEKLEKAKAKREKEIQVLSFQDRIDETKRQIEVRDKLLKSGYSKDTVDNMFPEVKDKTFLQYLKDIETTLQNMPGAENAENFTKIQSILSDYTGSETFIENVNKQIDELKAKFSGNELIDKLEKFKKANLEGTTGDEKNAKNIAITKAQQDELQKQKDLQNTFLKDKETFEQKKLEIESRYNELRKRIQDSGSSDAEKARLTEEANKDQAKEISTMSWEQFQKTDAYVKAFGDLEKVGPRTLKKLRDQFKEFIESEPGKALNIQDLKALNEVYSKLDEATKNRNPFEAIGIAVEKYKKKREELNKIEKESGKDSEAYQQKLDDTRSSFEEIVDTSYDASKKMIGYFSGITEAVGGMSNELRATISDVEQLVEGVYNAFKGFYGNKGQMITGIIQIVGSLSKIMNGDNKKEAEIKGWQRDIEDLKFLYEQLNKEIEKTAGEASLKKYTELIANLKKQQAILNDMRSKESEKKNPDVDKVNSYADQIRQISVQIQELVDTFKQTVTTVEFKDLSKKLADALTEAFAQGEDAAESFDKVVDDVMRNAVQNALKMKFLDEAAQNMVDQLYSSMGFGNGSTSAVQSQITDAEKILKEIEEKLKTASLQEGFYLENAKKEQLERLKLLQQQLSEISASGSFDGLTPEERDKIKAMGEDAMKKYMEALKQYQDLFGQSAENAQGLKGDIKGITEKTAGALEGQFNAVRINISEVLKIMKGNQTVANAQTVLLSKIESNTSNLIQIRKDMAELNNKIKPGLAGIP